MVGLTSLQVIMSNGVVLGYPNPLNHICFSIARCEQLKPAMMITWYDLPKHSFAMFFDDTNCYSGGKHYVFKTDQGVIDGSHVFKEYQSIRSMMVGVNNDAVNAQKLGTDDIALGCWSRPLLGSLKVSNPAFDSTTVKLNATTLNATGEVAMDTFAVGTSSNWSEPLPEASE